MTFGKGKHMKRTVRAIASLAIVLVSCGGADDTQKASGGPRDGVHSHGGEDAFNVSLVTRDVIADVTVEPINVGDVIVHMEFAPPGGKLQQVLSVIGVLRPIDDAQSVLELAFENSGVNHFHFDVSVPTPGDWMLEFDAVLADGATLQYATTVTFES